MKTDTNKTNSTNRRKLLKKMGAGGGALATASAVPGEWSKPIVKGILLPAHASTTATDSLPEDTCNPEYGFVEATARASWQCGTNSYLLYCEVSPPGADVQVEVSGTGICPGMEGPHDKTSPVYDPEDYYEGEGEPYTSYKWYKFPLDCDAPEDFTAVFSIVDACAEPVVVPGNIYDGCEQDL